MDLDPLQTSTADELIFNNYSALRTHTIEDICITCIASSLLSFSKELSIKTWRNSPLFFNIITSFTKKKNQRYQCDNRYQCLCLTLLPFVSPPSESWAHTLWDFSPVLQVSPSQPAIVFKISDCSHGHFSFIDSNPSVLMIAAMSPNKKNHLIKHVDSWKYIKIIVCAQK